MNDVIPLLKFTPSAQDPEVLEAITVQREPLVTRLVEVALDTEGARHQLLIGPRGIGKTHILSLVASRVRAEADLGSIALAWLEEDPWGVGSYEKFLAAIVAAIAEERSDPELQTRADELHALRGENGREGEEALREVVGDSRLVLLVENLDDIFRRIGENGQERFRAFVEDWQQMLIVATAQQLFEGVQLHESPFYGFFAITRLKELSLDSATELMRRIAELRGDQDLTRYLRSDVARRRLAAVEALAGGHPRIWLLLSGCVSIDAIDELVPLFLEALDDLTPYYQDRLRELGDQQQELVVLLSEAGGALSNRALSERSGIAQNQIATILGQLADRGYVRRAEVPEEISSGDARMSYWELREPLMRLCLDVKQARGKPLRMVVEFLRAWYGARLLDELMALPPTAELATTYVSEAFRTLPGVLPRNEVFRGSTEEILARAEAGLLADPERLELQVAKATMLLAKDRYAEARDMFESLIPSMDIDRVRLALELQLIAAKKRLGESVEEEPVVEEVLKLAKAEPDDLELQELLAMGLNLVDRHEEALEVFQRAAELGSDSPAVKSSYGRSLVGADRFGEALAVLRNALELEPSSPGLHVNYGFACRRSGKHGEALEAFEKAIELDPGRAEHYHQEGITLVELGRYEDALKAFDRGLELDPQNAKLLGAKSIELAGLERYSEALVALTQAIKQDAGNRLLVEVQGILFKILDRPVEALGAFRRSSEIEPDNASPFNHQANLLRDMDRLDEAEQAARRAIELDAQDPIYRFTLSEISFARGNFSIGVDQLREALAIWSKTRDTPPGETELICSLLWERWEVADASVIDQVVEVYEEVEATEELGHGLVKSSAWVVAPEVSAEKADAWVDAWAGARQVDDLQIPLRLLKAAAAWKKDQDRAHLLALPPEQREILVGLLTPPATGDDPSS